MTKPDNSHIEVDGNRVAAYVGRDAVDLFRAKTLAQGIRMWIRTKMIPTRGVTITRMLELATGYTGKKYTRAKAQQAYEDVLKWAAEMEGALPRLDREGKQV